jgi:hypothetical protein
MEKEVVDSFTDDRDGTLMCVSCDVQFCESRPLTNPTRMAEAVRSVFPERVDTIPIPMASAVGSVVLKSLQATAGSIRGML